MTANPLDDTDPARRQRIRERAYQLWEQDGRPHGRDADFWERARELVGMEESKGAGLLDNPETHQTLPNGRPEGVEEAEMQANLGEFPGRLADQGERPTAPVAKPAGRARKKKAASAGRRGPPKPAGSG